MDMLNHLSFRCVVFVFVVVFVLAVFAAADAAADAAVEVNVVDISSGIALDSSVRASLPGCAGWF